MSTTAESIRVDRGQPVIVTVTFGELDAPEDPDDVYFTYTQPGEERPHVDDGFGQTRSRITRLGRGVYRYVISTRDFKAGAGMWHFFGEWQVPRELGHDEAHIFGAFFVNDAPQQLL
jgi:hypothetical protein